MMYVGKASLLLDQVKRDLYHGTPLTKHEGTAPAR
jgi:hypothetical protein